MPRFRALFALLPVILLSSVFTPGAFPDALPVSTLAGTSPPAESVQGAPLAPAPGNDDLEGFYDLLKNGRIEDLRAECVRRSLSDAGDVWEIRRRLLEHQRGIDSTPFEERLREAAAHDIILRHADSIEYSLDEKGDGVFWLRGDVDVSYAGKEIRADEVNVNTGARIVTGNGNIVFTDGQRRYLAQSFFYNVKSGEGLFFEARTSLGKFFYSGRTIRLPPEVPNPGGKGTRGERFIGEKMSLTTCDLDNPHYRIEAERLYYYGGAGDGSTGQTVGDKGETGRVLIENGSFSYGNEPVIGLPYAYRRLKKRAVQTAFISRERSGLSVQNTYTPIETDERALVLKGDFYERLGIYGGADFRTAREKRDTAVWGSLALSNDVYNEADFGQPVSGTWTPLGPPGASTYSIDRSIRYRAGYGGRYVFGKTFDNTLEIDLAWVSDPYYEYDFERRLLYPDIFSLLGQAEYDAPVMGKGFGWRLDDTFTNGPFSVSLKNRVRFEPQRNTGVDVPSLPDYYTYRLYTLTAPDVTATHTSRLFEGSTAILISGLDYQSLGHYRHAVYYDEEGKTSSELHGVETSARFTKSYPLSDVLRLVPAVELGAQGQSHVDPDGDELADDRQKTLLYGRIVEEFTIGKADLFFALTHDLKYKLLGPEDLYEYGNFKVHLLAFKAYGGTPVVSDTITTSYDLRPIYDWSEDRYTGTIFEMSRFAPLINTFTLAPLPVLRLSDKLVYDIARNRLQTNSFRLKYSSDAVYLKGLELKAGWDLVWEHNFISPFLDLLDSTFIVEAKPHPFWTLSVSVLSRNEEFWKYYPTLARERGIEPVNPIVDLLKSYNFFNREDREESGFKLKGVSAGFTHDLHDWILRGGYSGNRELSYDRKSFEWNNVFWVSLSLKDVKNVDIHTEYTQRR